MLAYNLHLIYKKTMPSGKDPNTPTYILDSCPILRFFGIFASSVICPFSFPFLTNVPLLSSLDFVRLCGQRSHFRFPALDGGVLHDLIDLHGLINALSCFAQFLCVQSSLLCISKIVWAGFCSILTHLLKVFHFFGFCGWVFILFSFLSSSWVCVIFGSWVLDIGII